mmetsp:Transcript_26613/g.66711  ORF Transcript_26613/g.66711 Transcript_26613/m.66711 type:complete len:119 (-) Transcript_26613:646-1002(-)
MALEDHFSDEGDGAQIVDCVSRGDRQIPLALTDERSESRSPWQSRSHPEIASPAISHNCGGCCGSPTEIAFYAFLRKGALLFPLRSCEGTCILLPPRKQYESAFMECNKKGRVFPSSD